ncbi:toxin [Bacteroidia bacterium]|nr:toxin [Bacteroidia bacterium]
MYLCSRKKARQVEFEFDNDKSVSNEAKHGINFVDAQKLWTGDVLEQLTQYPDEERYLNIGNIDGKFWTAVITYRESVTRIISVRRARKQEVLDYVESIS